MKMVAGVLLKGNAVIRNQLHLRCMALKSLEGNPFDRQTTAGLKWLLQHQKDDGSWSLNDDIETKLLDHADSGARAIVFSGPKAACLEGGEMDFDARGKKARLGRIALVPVILS